MNPPTEEEKSGLTKTKELFTEIEKQISETEKALKNLKAERKDVSKVVNRL